MNCYERPFFRRVVVLQIHLHRKPRRNHSTAAASTMTSYVGKPPLINWGQTILDLQPAASSRKKRALSSRGR